MNLGSALRAARVAGNVSLRSLAFDLCITDVELGELERGVREPEHGWRSVFETLGQVIERRAYIKGIDEQKHSLLCWKDGRTEWTDAEGVRIVVADQPEIGRYVETTFECVGHVNGVMVYDEASTRDVTAEFVKARAAERETVRRVVRNILGESTGPESVSPKEDK